MWMYDRTQAQLFNENNPLMKLYQPLWPLLTGVTVVQWLDWTCNHKVEGSNPTKPTADFTMTRISIVV